MNARHSPGRFSILAIAVCALANAVFTGVAFADLLPHITYTIDSPSSDLTVDTEADVELSIIADVNSDIDTSRDTGPMSGSFIAAFGPSREGGPGRIYFRSGTLSGGALQSSTAVSVPLIALTGDVDARTRDIVLVLDTTAGIPFADTTETAPNVYSFGPVDLTLAVDRSVDWSVDEQGGTPDLMMGTESAMNSLFVTAAASGTVEPSGGSHDVTLNFVTTDVTTLNAVDTVFLPSEGANLDIDADLSVTQVDVDLLGASAQQSIIPVPEPGSLALRLAAITTIGVVARARRR